MLHVKTGMLKENLHFFHCIFEFLYWMKTLEMCVSFKMILWLDVLQIGSRCKYQEVNMEFWSNRFPKVRREGLIFLPFKDPFYHSKISLSFSTYLFTFIRNWFYTLKFIPFSNNVMWFQPIKRWIIHLSTFSNLKKKQ
jgi:hypothetical protein